MDGGGGERWAFLLWSPAAVLWHRVALWALRDNRVKVLQWRGAAFVLRIDHTSNYIECHKAVCWQIGAVNTVGSTTTSIKRASVGQVYCVSTGDKWMLCLDLWSMVACSEE